MIDSNAKLRSIQMPFCNNDTGRPLKDTAAAVTAWASTWRIPQFKTVGLPTMGGLP
ncbi:hypothetical protein HTS61_08100 [Escherichia coli]|nr:hypothetical protein [Escherichia coli]